MGTKKNARIYEYEIRAQNDQPLPKTIRGSFFYYVCEGETGACLYLQNDIVLDN